MTDSPRWSGAARARIEALEAERDALHMALGAVWNEWSGEGPMAGRTQGQSGSRMAEIALNALRPAAPPVADPAAAPREVPGATDAAGAEPEDKVVELMAALERSVNDAKAAAAERRAEKEERNG